MFRASAVALCALLVCAPALADEVWSSERGEIVWEAETALAAVFSYPSPNAKSKRVRLYIEGLAGESDGGRGTYSGYWIDEADGELCPAALTDPAGAKSHRWGRLQLTFASPYFPSDWIALLGDCLAEPDTVLAARTSVE